MNLDGDEVWKRYEVQLYFRNDNGSKLYFYDRPTSEGKMLNTEYRRIGSFANEKTILHRNKRNIENWAYVSRSYTASSNFGFDLFL